MKGQLSEIISYVQYLMFLFESVFPALKPKPEWLKCQKSLDKERGLFRLVFLDNKDRRSKVVKAFIVMSFH